MSNETQEIEQIANTLEEHIYYRSEAGVFRGTSKTSVAKLARGLESARKSIITEDNATARRILIETYANLHEAVNEKSTWWRLIHIHALDIYIYLIIWAILIIVVGFLPLPEEFLSSWKVPSSIIAFGALGGTLRGLWWITKKVEARNHRTQFRIQYYAGPIIAAGLGIVAYLFFDILSAGLTTSPLLTGENIEDEVVRFNSKADGGSNLSVGMNALAFLAGFYWEWVIEKIKPVHN